MHCTQFNANINSSACVCVGSRARQREPKLITISDDSDEEPVTLVPGSPVLVPDDADDDDISILEVTDKSLLCKSQRHEYLNLPCCFLLKR